MYETTLFYHGTVPPRKSWRSVFSHWRSGDKFKADAEMVRQLCQEAALGGWKSDRHQDATFNIEIKIWNKDRRHRDIGFQSKAILGALSAAKIIPSSAMQQVKVLTSTCMGIDKEDPRAMVHIEEFLWMS